MSDILVLVLLLIGVTAGFIGALTGLGGGVVLVPLLTLLLGVSIAYASGASLIATIATSSAAGGVYIRDRITNVKIGMSLEIATTLGAIIGALIAGLIYAAGLDSIVYIVFGLALLSSIYLMVRKRSRRKVAQDSTTKRLQLTGEYTDAATGRTVRYYGARWWAGEAVMLMAGVLSGLLGIGSGALKVLGMDWVMNLPTKVSTATSNFMIGVTAAAGSVIFWELGYVQPFLAGTTAIGVLAGAVLGSVVFERLASGRVRLLFIFVLVALAAEMLLRGVGL
jgi:uncharacterized membrane protein YfcA